MCDGLYCLSASVDVLDMCMLALHSQTLCVRTFIMQHLSSQGSSNFQ